MREERREGRERPEERMTKPPVGSERRSDIICSWNGSISLIS